MNARDTMPPIPAHLVEATLADVEAVRVEMTGYISGLTIALDARSISLHDLTDLVDDLTDRVDLLHRRLDQLDGPY